VGGLLSGLGVGYSGIAAARAGLQLTSQNINNANTDGYHRRRIDQSSKLGPPVFGGGVSVDGVVRIENRLLGTQVETSGGRQGFASARQGLLSQVETIVGDLGEDGIGGSISRLFSSFSQLAATPGDGGARDQVLSAANQLVNAFNHASSRLDALQSAIDDNVEVTVQQANGQLAEVAELNGRILQIEASGGNAAELRDRQDTLLAELAGSLGVQSFAGADGQTTVLLGGMSLVQDDHAVSLETAPNAALGGHLGVVLVAGSDRHELTADVGGAVGGQLAVRDQSVGDARTRLDQLAFDIGTAVNGAHAAGFGLDGSTGNDLFLLPASAADAAGQIALNSAVGRDQLAAASTAGGAPGDGANALALAQLADDATVAGGGARTATQEAGALVGWIGSEVDAAIAEEAAASDELAHLETLAESEEGVSLDEEMVRLIEYQRSYQASTRVMQVFDQMLEQLMRL
jgi:flagellar hook-associated protein 1 FlgK